MRIIASAVVGLLCAVHATTAAADSKQDCENEALRPASRIAACSAIVAAKTSDTETRADAFATRGSLLDDLGRHDEALADFNAALKLVPNDPATLILRGNAYDSKGERALALADYTEAIRLNPGDASGYFNRAIVLEETGERAKAIADYRKVLEIDPSFEPARSKLAALEKPVR